MSTIITHRQFPNYRKYTMDLAGRPLSLEELSWLRRHTLSHCPDARASAAGTA